ncbi:MAG TPA: signal recognition particle-docking protein FtsY [Actinomycetota bacterium]
MGPWIAIVIVVVVAVVLVVFLRARRRPAAPPTSSSAARTAGQTVARPPGRSGLGARIRSIVRADGATADWDALGELLIRADVGPATADRIVRDVRDAYEPGSDPSALVADEIRAVLGEGSELDLPADRLGVVLVVGVNGSGKTTTIGKLAARFAAEGRQVSLAGSDTFRAAASEQLEVWAERSGAHLVQQSRGADPGSVAFDAVKAAEARGSDVLIVDTAGRLHTKQPLMEELKKVRRVLEKAAGRAPDETLLVLDATTGQNGIAQARAFTEAVQLTGVALTKLDGTAKGGVVLAVRDQLGVPIKLVGTGETAGDLQPFDRDAFTERMLSD